MSVPASWPPLYVPSCPLHDVPVPLSHVPEHTWLGLSEEAWAVNLGLYATQPERFLQLQCEGECWCRPPDARAHSWAGHGRGPTTCPFESRSLDEGVVRALVAMRQAQAAGQPLPPCDPALMLEAVAALAHQPGWCACLPAMLTRLDELPDYLARGWTFDSFPAGDPARTAVREWIDSAGLPPAWLFVSGGVGRGKTGLAAAVAHRFVTADPRRTAFLGRLGPVREELAGETGAVLAGWLAAVDLLMLDDLDFGWAGAVPGDRASQLLVEVLQARLAAARPVVLTAHVSLAALAQDIDPAVAAVVTGTPWSIVEVADGPSLRTSRRW